MFRISLGLLLLVFIATPSIADRSFDPYAAGKLQSIGKKKVVHKRAVKGARVVVKRVKVKQARTLKPRKTIWSGFRAEAVTAVRTAVNQASVVLGGRPTGCPARAWCGCWLAKHLGLDRRELWLARNWARLGAPSTAQPGAIVVFSRGRGGHVGKITAVDGNRIKVLSGNDGRTVRERWRTTGRVIAYRML